MKKVMFMIESMVVGGAEKALIDLVNNLDPKKYDVTIIYIFKHSVYPNYNYKFKQLFNENIKIKYLIDNSNKIKYRCFNFLYNKLPKSWFYKVFIREKYDIEVAFYEGFPTTFLSYSNNKNSKKVAWLHTDSNNAFAGMTNEQLSSIKNIYDKYDLIVGVSKAVCKSFYGLFGMKDRLRVQYNVIDTQNVIKQSNESIDIDIKKDKIKFAEAFKIQEAEQDPFRGKAVVQPHGNKFMVQNKPEPPLNREELDEVYALPYTKNYHPSYEAKGGIPALNEVKFSIVSSRGCFGSCSFCAITFHQGRAVQSRSHDSILEEVKEITHLPDFKGYIHDVGGPTANFRQEACKKQITEGKGGCKNRQCLDPNPCKNLNVDHKDYVSLLRKVRQIPGVKKAFVRSGIRYDYVMADKDNTFMKELIKHHVSGQLKVAPEHVAEEVLYYMQKPAGDTYDRFRQKFFAMNEQMGLKQYLIPYLMSSHPGSTLNSAIELAEYLRDIKYQPEQVQDFYPTPGTLSTTMFYTGIDPRTMKEVYMPKSKGEKAMQRALLQYSAPRNYDLVHAALVEAGREDLIGFGPKCLIKPKDARGSLNRQFDKNKKHNKSNDRNSRGGKNNKNTDRRNNKSNSRDNRSSSSKGKKRNKR